MNKTAVRMLGALACLALTTSAQAQFGPILTGAGPVNRSMGGTGTAVAASPAGPLVWNPAALAGLSHSELEVGAELLIPQANLTSSIPAGSLGAGLPPVDLAGSTDNQDAVFALPTIALSYRSEELPMTFGLGVFALAGFGLDYPASTTNPLLTPPAPAGLGFGAIYSNYQALQIAPAIVLQTTDTLSISFSPLLNLGMVQLDPAVIVPPDDANGDGFATYPAGTHSRTSWGAGFQFGLFYKPGPWSVGASYKSPQWFETYDFNTVDELGFPTVTNFAIDLPSVVSVGVGWDATSDLVLAADLRYIDFSNAKGLGDSGFNADGSLRGIGLESIFALAFGAQYRLTDALTARLGYSWSENPIPDSQASANVASPVIIEHVLSAGAGWQVTKAFALNASYSHAFENSIAGPITLPTGAIPGTLVRNTASVDMFNFGATVSF